MALIEKRGAGQADTFAELNRKAEEEAGLIPGTDPSGLTETEWDQLQGEVQTPVSVEAEETPAVVEAEPETEIVATPEPEVPVEAEPEEPEEEPAVAAKADADQLAELNKKLGQLINENAELRQEREQAAQQVQPQPLTETTVGWFDEMAEQNPLQAAYWALQNQQPILYDRAIRVAYDQDPVAAGRYERQVEAAQQEARMKAELAPQIADAQQMAHRAQLDQALATVQGRHEDFAQVVGTLSEERAAEIVEGGFPVQVLEGLNGDQQSKERVFETLYRWVKAEQTGQLVQAATENAGKQAEESRAAKVAATVASASTTTPEAVPETEEERFTRFLQSEKQASMRSAWQGQDSRRTAR